MLHTFIPGASRTNHESPRLGKLYKLVRNRLRNTEATTCLVGALLSAGCGSSGGKNDDFSISGFDSGLTDTGSSGTDTGSEAPVDNTPAITAGCTELNRAVCAQIFRCKNTLLLSLYPDEAACLADNKVESCVTRFKRLGANVTPGEIVACVEESKKTCGNPGPACARLGRGALVGGSKCVDGAQCESGTCLTDATGCGNCVLLAKSGEACATGAPIACERGSYCAKPSGKCEPQLAIGSVCTSNAVCDGVCTLGKCTAPLVEGSACDPAKPFQSCGLTNGLICNEDTAKCQAITFVKPGEACLESFTAPKLCLGSRCKLDTPTGESGTCVPWKVAGDTCADDECLPNISCTSGKCMAAATCAP